MSHSPSQAHGGAHDGAEAAAADRASPSPRGRPRTLSQDEEMIYRRRREKSITLEEVAGLEKLTDDNLKAVGGWVGGLVGGLRTGCGR